MKIRANSNTPVNGTFFLTAFLFSTCLSAQNPNIVNGYYISTKGDSISGQIDLGKTGGHELRFKSQDEKKWKDLDAMDVKKAGGDNGLLILTGEIRSPQDTEQVFVQKTIGGGYNLYEGKSRKWGTVYYINSKDNPTLLRVNKLGYDTQLKTMFAPCSKQIKLQQLRYSSNYLQRYIAEINRCAYPGEPPYEYRQPLGSEFSIGLNAFYYSMDPVVNKDGVAYAEYGVVNRPGLALSFRFNITPAFAVYTGLGYVNKNIYSNELVERVDFTVDKPGIPPYQAYDYYRFSKQLNYTYLETPLGMSYTLLPYRKWSPDLNFGFTYLHPLAHQVINDYGDPICEPCTQPDTGPSSLYSLRELPVNKTHRINFFGGIALKRQVNAHHQIEMNLGFYRQREVASYITEGNFPRIVSIDMKTHRLQAGLAYYYLFNKKL